MSVRFYLLCFSNENWSPLPLLTLGVPGDVVTAVLLSSLLIQGIQPGPQLFETHGSLVYTIMIGFILVNILMFFIVKSTIRWFSTITLIPAYLLFPFIFVLCLVGSYAFNNSMSSVWIALVFGVVGFILPKFGYPVIPMVIAIILGPMAESSFRQSLVMSGDSLLIFVQRPIAAIFLALAFLSAFLPIYNRIRRDRLNKKQKQNEQSEEQTAPV